MYCIPHIGYEYHTISWDGVYCIPKMGMLSVSREITPFWYEIHTFVLTVCFFTFCSTIESKVQSLLTF